ncbi:MAG: triple tyrosine motif-containing protein, partial [Bacteroidota bacterium]
MIPSLEAALYRSSDADFPQEAILHLDEDQAGNLFLASNDNQVRLFQPPDQIIHHYRLPRDGIETIYYHAPSQRLFVEANELYSFDDQWAEPTIVHGVGSTPKDMQAYKDHQLLVASGNGAYVVKPRSPTLNQAPLDSMFRKNFHYRNYKDKKGSIIQYLRLRSFRSRAIWGDSLRNRIWVAYADDLYYYEQGKAFILKTKHQKAIIGQDMVQDARGVLWVATLRQGVFGIAEKQIKYHFDTSRGLISNNCRVIKTEGSELWIGTNQGLQCLNLENLELRTMDRQDGLISPEVNDLLIQKDKVWVGTSLGLMSFARDMNTFNQVPPPIYITGLKIWEKDTLLQTQEPYQLHYRQNNLKIEFRGLAFRSRGKFHYKYRLLNLDSTWVYADSKQNFARYPSLPPGDYTFEVKAVNEDGVESNQAALLQLQIAYP